MEVKVCHLTSAHPRYDTRIFVKQCRSLASNGFSVTLLVADGVSDEIIDGVTIKSIPKTNGRLNRMWFNVNRIYELALEEKADIYHLHDPELLRIALKLKKRGKKVIFDSHEDVTRQILGKFWIPTAIRNILSKRFEAYQNRICSQINGVVAATPFIQKIFAKINANSIDICNYPIFDEFSIRPINDNKSKVVYIGGISEVRGGTVMVKAINRLDNKLYLAGNFIPEAYKGELETLKGWEKTVFLGYLNRIEISKLLSDSFAGLVVLKPLINYLDALPVKMYEYMAAGVPVIASNFPLWQSIVEDEKCGLVVNPLNPDDLAQKIEYLGKNPTIVKQMGINGREAIRTKFNWQNEKIKLINFYIELLKNK